MLLSTLIMVLIAGEAEPDPKKIQKSQSQVELQALPNAAAARGNDIPLDK
jgi:hypothetical protein